MSHTIAIRPREIGRYRESVVVAAQIDSSRGRHELWYRVPRAFESFLTRQADPFVIGSVFLAMEEGEPVHVHGAVSASLLRNLEAFQAAWVSWFPARYREVAITADAEREPEVRGRAATVASFSGGVDACFSVYRHHRRLVGRRSELIEAAVMVQGFDVPLSDDSGFQQASARSARILESVGLPLINVGTNFRDLPGRWEDAHGAAVAAVLSLFAGRFSAGLIASGQPHRTFAVWGSNPVTDGLLSSDAFRILHDGAEASRQQKLAALAHWPAAMANLRVCWEGEDRGGNCGRCEKCIRTILAIRAGGHGLPPCFARDAADEDIRRIRISTPNLYEEYKRIHGLARERGFGGARWAREVSGLLRQYESQHMRGGPERGRVLSKLRSLARAMRRMAAQ